MTTLFNLITRALQRLFPNRRLANLECELATLKERSTRHVETACDIISSGIQEVAHALSKRIDHLAERTEEGATARDYISFQSAEITREMSKRIDHLNERVEEGALARDATNELVRNIALNKERPDPSAVAEHLDLADLAEHIDASDIAGHFDHSAIASEIDLGDIAGHLDLADIAEHIDLAEIMAHVGSATTADGDERLEAPLFRTNQSVADLETIVAAQAVDIAALKASVAAAANDLRLVTQAAEAFATALRPGDEADWAGFDND